MQVKWRKSFPSVIGISIIPNLSFLYVFSHLLTIPAPPFPSFLSVAEGSGGVRGGRGIRRAASDAANGKRHEMAPLQKRGKIVSPDAVNE